MSSEMYVVIVQNLKNNFNIEELIKIMNGFGEVYLFSHPFRSNYSRKINLN